MNDNGQYDAAYNRIKVNIINLWSSNAGIQPSVMHPVIAARTIAQNMYTPELIHTKYKAIFFSKFCTDTRHLLAFCVYSLLV